MLDSLRRRLRKNFTVQENPTRPVPHEAYNWRPYALACAACFAAANGGYCSFFTSVIHLESFQHAFHFTAEEINTRVASLIMSVGYTGGFAGCLFGYYVGERHGRRICLTFFAITSILASLMQTFSYGNRSLLFAGRFFTGWSLGAKIPILPAYIAEIAPSTIRGRLVGLCDIFAMFAQVVGYWIVYAVKQTISSEKTLQWQLPFALQTIPAFILVLSMSWAVESPRWLVWKGDIDKALQNLAWMRNLPKEHGYVQWEFGEMKNEIEKERSEQADGGNIIARRWRSLKAKVKEMTAKNMRRRLILILLLKTAHNLCGIEVLALYGPQIFQSIGFKDTSSKLLATGVFSAVKAVVNSILVLFFIDSIGRRRPLMIGSTIIVICFFFVGAWSHITRSVSGNLKRGPGSYAAAAMLYLYTAGFSISWAIVPFIFASEILPTRLRATGLMLVFIIEWGLGFAIVYSVPYMVKHLKAGTFFVFASCVLVGTIGAWIFLPETKGFELEKMHLLFEGPKFARKTRDRVDRKLREEAAREDSETSDVELQIVTAKHDGQKDSSVM